MRELSEATMEIALRNVLALAVKMKRRDERAGDATGSKECDALIRFCAEAGIVPSVLRADAEKATEPGECAFCNGSGRATHGGPTFMCPRCNGTGRAKGGEHG